MYGRFLIPVILFLLVTTTVGFSNESTVSSRMHWPPLFKRTFGDPKVSVVQRRLNLPTRLTYFYPTNKVTIKVNGTISHAEVNRMIRKEFLGMVWRKYLAKEAQLDHEHRLNMQELIPISQTLFMTSGLKWLENQSTGNEVLDCWWKVRMGETLTPSKDYTLAFSTILWADSERTSYGHYSFCLRKRGGDPNKDAMFDFRAPWTKDTRPTASDGLNLKNSLKISARRENLYDWIYTQMNFRNVDIRLRFVPIHEEQVKLLQAFSGFQDGGNFRVFRKNCASMGSLFAQRLLPLDGPLADELTLADLPLLASDRSVAIFGGGSMIADVTINNRTTTPSNRTALRKAPDRKTSHGFRYLLTVPEIN